MFVPRSLLSCSLQGACLLCCCCPSAGVPWGLLVFDESWQGCPLEGAVAGGGAWAQSHGCAPGNALCLVSCRGFVQLCQPGCLPQASSSTRHLPPSAVLCQLCHPAAAPAGETRAPRTLGLEQFGLLKGETQRVSWRETRPLPCVWSQIKGQVFGLCPLCS